MAQSIDELQAYFSNKENCINDIMMARETFGSTRTTEEQYDQMEKSLGLMYFYCPEEIQSIVESTLHESAVRKTYFIKMWDGQS